MEETWYTARRTLRHLLATKPHWALDQLAAACNQSVSWVKKWKVRFRTTKDTDDTLLWGLSRARHHPPSPTDPRLVERILAIRDSPPDNLQRTPGPKAILYYLPRDPIVREQGLKPLTSTRSIWKILDAHQRILRPTKKQLKAKEEQPPAYTQFQLDFKDIGTVSITPGGKKQHLVEVLNIVDIGSSIVHAAVARTDFTMATLIATLADLFQTHGVLPHLTCDRDPRFVGSHSGRDFPSVFLRFLYALNVDINICPPHRPDLNSHVERYHKSFGQECVDVQRPGDLAAVREMLPGYIQHYNSERPNQAVTCGNRPPRVAFPDLPALASVPLTVNLDAWLAACDGRSYARTINANGSIRVGDRSYYVDKKRAGQRVAVVVAAATKELRVLHNATEITRRAIKGLYAKEMDFATAVTTFVTEATRVQRLTRVAA